MYRISFKIQLDATKGQLNVPSSDEALNVAKEQAQKLYNSFQRSLKRNKYFMEGKVTYMVSYEE
jgi:hypothetical protein